MKQRILKRIFSDHSPGPNGPSSLQLNETLHRLVVGGAWYTTSAIVNRVLPNLLVIILALLVRPADLGAYSYILAFYTVLSLFADMGIAYALQKFIQENPLDAMKIGSTSLVLRFLSSLALGFLCVGVDQCWTAFKGYSLYVALLLISSAFGTSIYVLNARLKYKESSLLVIVRGVLWFVFAIIFVVIGQPVLGPIYSLAMAFVVIGILTVFLERSYFVLVFDWAYARRIMQFGVLMTIASAFSVLATQAGILVMAYLTTESEVGIYRLASTFGMIPMLLGDGLVLPLLPLIKKSFMEAPKDIPELIRLLIRYLSIIGFLILGTGVVLAKPLISLVFGPFYQSAVWPLRILLGSGCLGLLFTVLLSVSYMSNDLKIAAKISAVVAGLCLGLSVFLIPLYGASGAAIALLVAFGMGLILISRWLSRRLQVYFEWRKYGIYILSLAETIMMMFILFSFVPNLVFHMIGGIIFAPILYLTALFVQKGITGAEISRMRQILKAKP